MKHIIFSAIFFSGILFSVNSIAECTNNRNVDIIIIKPDSLYIDHGNGTVTDKSTGLMWQKCSLGLSGINCNAGVLTKYNWQVALAVANENSAGGYTDWRLPNMKELESLIEVACNRPAINQTIFPGTLSGIYWTSTPSVSTNFKNHSRIISFVNGDSSTLIKNSAKYVRLMRGD